MKKRKSHSAPVADEQLLFTPEEMFGDSVSAPSTPVDASAIPHEDPIVAEESTSKDKPDIQDTDESAVSFDDTAHADGENITTPKLNAVASDEKPSIPKEGELATSMQNNLPVDKGAPSSEGKNATALNKNDETTEEQVSGKEEKQNNPDEAIRAQNISSTTADRHQYTPHWAQHMEPDKAIEAFVDEDRIITEMTIALEFVDSLSLGEIRLIALEASVKWQNGIRPTGTYTIQSLPRYTFDGYKFLALYYVSFYQAFPSMIEKLNMPYDHLYLQARHRYDGYRRKQ